MKVLVANPPAYLWNNERRYIQAGSRWAHSMILSKEEVIKQRREGRYPYTPYPFYLGYATSYIADICDVKMIDGVVLNYDQNDFIKAVENYSPDLIVLEVATVTYQLCMRLISELKESTNAKIAIAGIHISNTFIDILRDQPNVDFALVNEFELSLRDLIEHNLDAEGIKGIAYRKNNAVKFNGPRPILKDISTLPFPYRDASVAFYDDFTVTGRPNIQMITSRGCPVGCNFCYTTIFYQNTLYRPRTPQNIVAEIKDVIDRFHPKQLYFDDDTITINPKHIRDLSREMITEGVDIPWTCMGDITVKRENIQIMKKAGCVGIKFGVESVSPETLQRMHKGIITADKTHRFMNMLREEGLWGHATFSLGHPGDTIETIKTSIEFAKSLRPNSLQVSIATPIPGTYFYEEAKNAGWMRSDNWNEFDGSKGSIIDYPQLKSTEIDSLYKQFVYMWNKELKKPSLRIENAMKKRKELTGRILGRYPKEIGVNDSQSSL